MQPWLRHPTAEIVTGRTRPAPRRRIAAHALIVDFSLLLLSACSTAHTPIPAHPTVAPVASPPSGPASVTSAVASASPTPAPCPTSPLPGSSTGLQAIGSSLVEWNAHHDADSAHPGWYLPAATDAPDRYTDLTCSADGHVTGYVMNFKPPLFPSDADHVLASELPPDAASTSTTRGVSCETRVYTSRELATVLPSKDPDGIVTAVTYSFAGSDGSVQLYRFVLSASIASGC